MLKMCLGFNSETGGRPGAKEAAIKIPVTFKSFRVREMYQP